MQYQSKDKVTGVGLRKDPYAISSELWQAEVPNMAWSDMFVYMVATPNGISKEEMKVSSSV